MIITFTNVIGAIRTAFSVVRSGLKMWLGFQTSETLGAELVSNGDFATDSDWILINNSTIVDGVANVVADGNIGNSNTSWSLKSLNNVFQLNKTYRIKFRAKQVSLAGSNAGAFQLGYSYFPLFDQVITNEFVDYEFVATPLTSSSILNLTAGGRTAGDVFQIDDISVKELTQITPDKSGNNNVGELFTGKALEFDGLTEYVDLGSQATEGSELTVVTWLKLNDLVGNQSILSYGDFLVRTDDTDIMCFGDVAVSFARFSDVLTTNNIRLVVTISGTSASLYLNGTLIDTKSISALSSDSSASYIGRYTSIWFLGGLLADLQYYNKAWTASDVAFDYNNPNHLAIDNPDTDLVVTDLKGYWALSEGDGLVAYDSSGEGNNGTINGAEYVLNQPRIPQLGMQNWSKGSNLLPYSEDFSGWTNQQITVIPNATTSPIGSGNATKIIATTVSTTHQINKLNLVASSTCVASIYTKAAGTNTLEILDGSSAVNGAFFDLDAESVTNRGSGIGTIESVGNGWYRCSTVIVTTGFRIYHPSAVSSISGDGASGIYIWGAQLEQSSSVGAYRLTDGAATLNSTVIPNPTIPTKDILGNLVRDRLNSFNLDGSGYAVVADDTDLDFGTSAFSFDGWAKYAFVNQGSSLNTIYTHLEDSANTSAGFSLNTETGGKISAWFGAVELELSAGLSEGDWFYFALTRDASGNVKLYASTDLENPATTTQNPILTITNAANKRVGGDATSIPNNGFSRHYHNLISDVRLYDADLSATEVENNYNAGLSAHTNN